MLAAATNRELGLTSPGARIPLSFSFSYNLADPLASTARMTWIDGDTATSGDVDWRFVGGPLPTRDELELFSYRLEMLNESLQN
jgi:hypothetical protein